MNVDITLDTIYKKVDNIESQMSINSIVQMSGARSIGNIKNQEEVNEINSLEETNKKNYKEIEVKEIDESQSAILARVVNESLIANGKLTTSNEVERLHKNLELESELELELVLELELELESGSESKLILKLKELQHLPIDILEGSRYIEERIKSPLLNETLNERKEQNLGQQKHDQQKRVKFEWILREDKLEILKEARAKTKSTLLVLDGNQMKSEGKLKYQPQIQERPKLGSKNILATMLGYTNESWSMVEVALEWSDKLALKETSSVFFSMSSSLVSILLTLNEMRGLKLEEEEGYESGASMANKQNLYHSNEWSMPGSGNETNYKLSIKDLEHKTSESKSLEYLSNELSLSNEASISDLSQRDHKVTLISASTSTEMLHELPRIVGSKMSIRSMNDIKLGRQVRQGSSFYQLPRMVHNSSDSSNKRAFGAPATLVAFLFLLPLITGSLEQTSGLKFMIFATADKIQTINMKPSSYLHFSPFVSESSPIIGKRLDSNIEPTGDDLEDKFVDQMRTLGSRLLHNTLANGNSQKLLDRSSTQLTNSPRDPQRWISMLAPQFGPNSKHQTSSTNTNSHNQHYPHRNNLLSSLSFSNGQNQRRRNLLSRTMNRIRQRIGARNTIRVHNAFRDIAWRILSRLSMPTPIIYELRRQNFYPIEEDIMNDSLFNKNTTKTIRTGRQMLHLPWFENSKTILGTFGEALKETNVLLKKKNKLNHRNFDESSELRRIFRNTDDDDDDENK